MAKDQLLEDEDDKLEDGTGDEVIEDEDFDDEDEDDDDGSEKEEEDDEEEEEAFDLPGDLDSTEHFQVTLRFKNKTKAMHCEIREFDGIERDKYLNREKNNYDRSGKLKSFKDIQSRLIAKALWNKDTNELVPIKRIRKFPASTLVKLYNKILDINQFDMERAKEDAKND